MDKFAGVAAGVDLLAGVSRYLSVPLAAIGVSLLALRGSFHRIEHVLLALSSVFVAYIVSGFLAHPDWGATARGLVVPGMPLTRDAVLVAVATLGTTLARGALRSSNPTRSTSGCPSRARLGAWVSNQAVGNGGHQSRNFGSVVGGLTAGDVTI